MGVTAWSMDEIADHAFLGDCHSCALVTRDARIDWACFPRFDSPSVFAHILDPDKGGSFDVEVPELQTTRRAYLEDTNVLVTTLTTADGELEVTDCMPVRAGSDGEPVPQHAILRRLVCTRGTLDVTVSCTPRPEYGAVIPRHRLTSLHTADVVGGADAIHVTATRPLASRRARSARPGRCARARPSGSRPPGRRATSYGIPPMHRARPPSSAGSRRRSPSGRTGSRAAATRATTKRRYDAARSC